jgi:phospholipase/carboxylesterase
VRLKRRDFLTVLPASALATLVACRGRATGDGAIANPGSDLQTFESGGGSTALMLLHGYGSSPQEWLPFTGTIALPPGRRFVFPEGPEATDSLGASFRGRQWWRLELERYVDAEHPVPDLSRSRPRELEPIAARVGTLIGEVERRIGAPPGSTVLGGHSQGAMIAAEVAFRSNQPMRALVLLAGTLVDEPSWLDGMTARSGLPVFIAHGRRDDILPFGVAERFADHMRRRGLRVTWVPHDGGHQITAGVVSELNAFLGGVGQ